MAIDLGALAVTIETRGLNQAQRDLAGIDKQGKQTGQMFDRVAQASKAVGESTLETTRRIMAQEAQAKGNAAALERLQRQARETFERIALDVGRATADYKLGIISLDDYRTALSVAKQEAIDLRAKTGALSPQQLAAFDSVLNNISKSTEAAARAGGNMQSQYASLGAALGQQATSSKGGINRMISGVSQLAVTMLGARSAVSSLATGALVTMGASAGVTLAVVAGAAAIGYAWDKLTASSGKLKDAVKSAREELEKPIKETVLAGLVDSYTRDVAKAEKNLASAQRGTQLFDPTTGGTRTLADPKAVAAAEKELQRLRTLLLNASEDRKKNDMESAAALVDLTAKQIDLNQATALEIEAAQTLVKIRRQQQAAETDPARRLQLVEQERKVSAALDEQRSRSIDLLRTQITLGLAAADASSKLRNRSRELSAAIADESTNTDRLIHLLRERADVQEALDAVLRRQIATTTTQADLGLTDRAETIKELHAEEAKLTAEIDKEAKGTDRLNQLLRDREQIQQRIYDLEGPTAIDPATGERVSTRSNVQPRDATLANSPDQQPYAPGVAGAVPSLLGPRGGAIGGGKSDDFAARFLESQRASIKDLNEKIATEMATMGQHAALAFGEGIANGLASDKPLQALGNTVLSGLGSIFTSMGAELMEYGSIMIGLQGFLANPFTSGPAALAAGILLVAVGKKLGGIALGGKGGAKGGGTGPQSYTHRVFVGADGVARETTQPTGAGASTFSPSRSIPINRDMNSLQPVQRVTHNWTLIGANDPLVQRGIADIVNAADKRGLVKVGG